jgi:hypothetical protein
MSQQNFPLYFFVEHLLQALHCVEPLVPGMNFTAKASTLESLYMVQLAI